MSHAVEHLRTNRTLVISRALASGLASLVPLPWIDELLAGAVRAQLIRRVAELRNVDLDGNAIAILSDPSGGRLLNAAGLGALALGGTRRIFRRIAASLFLVRRIDEAVETFHVGTLFDHYCTRHHLGLGLDGARAALLRHAMDTAVRQTRGEAVQAIFRDALAGAASAALRLPRAARDALVALAGRKEGRDKAEDGTVRAEQVDEGPVRELLDDPTRAAARRVAALEGGYLATLVGRFDIAWAALLAAQPTLPSGRGQS